MKDYDLDLIATCIAQAVYAIEGEDCTYTVYRKICQPFVNAYTEKDKEFKPERFIARSYEFYKRDRKTDIQYSGDRL